MKSTVSYECNLIKVGELRTSNNNKSYLPINVARNYSIVDENGNWSNLGSGFSTLFLYGKVAETFVQSNIPLGTTLLVTGRFTGQQQKAYVDKNGVEHPAQFVENLFVDEIAVKLTGKVTLTVNKLNNPQTNSTIQSQQNNQPTIITQDISSNTSVVPNNVHTESEDDDSWDFLD